MWEEPNHTTGRESLVFYKSFNTICSKHKKKYETWCSSRWDDGLDFMMLFLLEIKKRKEDCAQGPFHGVPPPAAYTGTTLTSHTERRQAT